MSTTPRLAISYLAPAQAQKHVTVNDALRRLDALVQLAALSRSTDAQPSAPDEGDIYLLSEGKSGADWSGMAAHAIAYFRDGAWEEIAPAAGWRAHVLDEGLLCAYDGADWSPLGGGAESAAIFGVNADADATNRLTVKSDAELLSHDDVTPGSGDARKIINRASDAHAASVVFQTDFSGRAEFGLVGDEYFRLKVSGDGSAFEDAILIDVEDGSLGVGGAPKAQLFVKGANVTDNNIGDIHIEKEAYFALLFLDTFSSGGAFDSSYSIQRRARGSVASPAAVQSGDWCGGFSFRGYSPSAAWVQGALISAVVDTAPSGAAVPMSLAFSTGTTSAAERMRIKSNGDVGIGTTAPSTKLHVDGPVRVKSYTAAGAPSASGSGAGAVIFVSNETGGAVLAFSDGSNWRRVTDRAVVS